MEKITLGLDGRLLKVARERAADENTTIEAKFQQWLEDYVQRKALAARALATIEELRRKHPPQDRKFTREAMNER